MQCMKSTQTSMAIIPQFGIPSGEYFDRPGAYVVALRSDGALLALDVRGKYHLPGGGIDQGEDPRATAIRETREEAGYEIDDVREIGRANQFLPNASLGPMNKLGIFFRATVLGPAKQTSTEDDHVVTWITPEEFLASTANDFQKWAVRQV